MNPAWKLANRIASEVMESLRDGRPGREVPADLANIAHHAVALMVLPQAAAAVRAGRTLTITPAKSIVDHVRLRSAAREVVYAVVRALDPGPALSH